MVSAEMASVVALAAGVSAIIGALTLADAYYNSENSPDDEPESPTA